MYKCFLNNDFTYFLPKSYNSFNLRSNSALDFKCIYTFKNSKYDHFPSVAGPLVFNDLPFSIRSKAFNRISYVSFSRIVKDYYLSQPDS